MQRTALALNAHIIKLKPIDPSVEETLRECEAEYKAAIQDSEKFRETSKEKWCGNPLPGEPGYEAYEQWRESMGWDRLFNDA